MTNSVKLTRLHQQRWDAAKRLFQRMKALAADPDVHILMDGQRIKPEQICIEATELHVRWPNGTRYLLFRANPNEDEGLYTPIKEFETSIRKDFQLVKPLNYWSTK